MTVKKNGDFNGVLLLGDESMDHAMGASLAFEMETGIVQADSIFFFP